MTGADAILLNQVENAIDAAHFEWRGSLDHRFWRYIYKDSKAHEA